jgi:hypothetical protein
MGFTKADFPPVDPESFLQQPLMERMKVLSVHWVEHGFGSPRMIHAIYIVKLLFFYVLGGVALATWTSHLPPFWDVAGWWNQPIVYEKAVLWTVLLETIGVAGSWGPLAGKFKPMTGGIRFWARPGTIRLRPWRVPFTAGDRRTWFDVVGYLALVVSIVIPLVLGGVARPSLSAALPNHTSGLGVTERGTWQVADAVREQPWLPNGPIPTEVTWSRADQRAAERNGQEHGHDVGMGVLT